MSVFGIAVFSLLVLSCYGISKEGDSCTMKSTGKPGVCTLIANCGEVLQAALVGVGPQICSLKGTVPVVCCESSSPISPTCDPLPSTAVKISKTGAKARDYCISLAEAGYPCTQTDNGWTRKDICPVVQRGPRKIERRADTNEFPHLVALSYDDSTNSDNDAFHHLGSLISDQWVLTEEYCARKALYAIVGGLRWNVQSHPELLFNVTMRFIHPDVASNFNNVGLLKLDRKVTFSKTVFPACLHAGTPFNQNELTYITLENNVYLKRYVKILTHDDCIALTPIDVRNTSQMCVRRPSGTEIQCLGGSPIQTSNNRAVACTQLLVGMHTAHVNEDSRLLATRVYGFLPWIEMIVWP